MRRSIINQLSLWKNSAQRKPLVLKGVRQVGKTWLLKEFGKQHYENIAYFNFDEQSELKQYFEMTKDVQRILQHLSLINGSPILPGKTLIIFDEIQECNAAFNALKYFCEDAPNIILLARGRCWGSRFPGQLRSRWGKWSF